MAKETQVNNLIINKLTKAQYDSAEKSNTELYFVTDEKMQMSDIEGLETALSSKQDKLTSGTNIKTINGETVLGEGNITISTGAEIDDTTASTTTVYSSNKVDTLLSYKQDILTQNTNSVSVIGSFAMVNINPSYNYYTLNVTKNTTINFILTPDVDISNKVCTFELKITMSTVYTLSFPGVKWLDNETPDMSEPGVYFLVFRTDDNGITWYGNLQGRWSI